MSVFIIRYLSDPQTQRKLLSMKVSERGELPSLSVTLILQERKGSLQLTHQDSACLLW